MPIELVTFDLDDTLWDARGLILEAEESMQQWLAEHAKRLEPAPERRQQTRDLVLTTYPDAAHDISLLRLRMLEQMLRDAGFSPEKALDLAHGAFEVFMAGRHRVQLFDGVHESLSILAERYTLVSLTNGNADIARLGLNRYFRFGLSAASVGAAKPDPAMFYAALARTSVAPQNAVHVGDHPIHDIEPARALGMQVVWFNSRDASIAPELQPPPPTTKTFREIPEIISNLMG